MKTVKWIPLLITLAALVSGCGKTAMTNQSAAEENPPVTMQSQPVASNPEPAAETQAGDDSRARFLEQLVLFDFDSAVLVPEAQSMLQHKAQWLKDNPDVAAVLIEGHCDERGTGAYNMALGAKRAQAVKNYLIDLGVDIRKLDTRSFGEEKPAVQGHSEEAWARNRRASFVIN